MKGNTYRSHEFLYVDKSFSAPYSDFTDDSVFSPEERKEYLTRYAEYLKGFYDLPDESLYAARLDEARELTKRLDVREVLPQISTEEHLTLMQASLVDAPRTYRDWSLYTGKSVVQDGTLLLKDAKTPPSPAAMYHIPAGARMKSFEFSFWMDEKYCAPLTSTVGVVVPKRHIDVRAGVLDLLRISIYSNGELYVSPMQNPYHHGAILVGNVTFNAWQTCKINMDGENFTVEFNGAVSKAYPLSSPADPDGIFFSGGMYHVGDWKIRPISLSTEAGEITDFFAPACEPKGETVSIGAVTLPHAVGTYENRDKLLVLECDIIPEEGYRNTLLFDALDPGGRVYVDDTLLATVDGFDSFSVDVSAFADSKPHHLRIEVDPRAPEVLYTWHRHRDPYNGWFCERVRLVKEKDIAFSSLRAITTSVKNGKVDLLLTGSVNDSVAVKVYMTNIWPILGEEKEIAAFSANGEFSEARTVEAKAWTPDTPELYALRFVAIRDGAPAADAVVETGFRTIGQKDGKFILNGEPVVLKGNLIMQYLPPYEEIPLTHICPRSEQIAWQYQMNKNLNGNTIRLHILGYGTNDERFARYADRMGVMLIWITRHIDSVAQVAWDEIWQGAEAYANQMRARINHPSIIMWEGANEPQPSLHDIDKIYTQFVALARSVDTTRLLSPTSHHYYKGLGACNAYTYDGKHDLYGNAAKAPDAWFDPLVVRSTHPYIDLLGYGLPWDRLRTQPDKDRRAMIESRDFAYMASEFAVIGWQDPRTPEAQIFINRDSYELCNNDVLGFELRNEDWLIAQAWQALAGHHSIKQLRRLDVDGMLWCCLMGGANNASYLKPMIDNYGYAKLGFYTMREAFADAEIALADVDTKKGANFTVAANLYGKRGCTYAISAVIKNEGGEAVASYDYGTVACTAEQMPLPTWDSGIAVSGYYAIEFTAEEC